LKNYNIPWFEFILTDEARHLTPAAQLLNALIPRIPSIWIYFCS